MKTKKIFKILFVIFFFSFFLSSCFFNTDNKKEEKKEEKTKIEQNKKEEKKVNLESPLEVKKLIDSGDYQKVISNLEAKGLENLGVLEKKNLVISYLRYGNSFFEEKKYSLKAMELLNKLEENYETLYYKGYAKEIIKEYKEALDYYHKGLKDKSITKSWKAKLLNQIGHIYDLRGSLVKANLYYLRAEKMVGDEDFVGVYLQRGRVEARRGNIEKAIEYFDKVLEKEKENRFLRAEVYSNLASLFLNKKDGVDRAIEYAENGIAEQEKYFGNYIVLSLAYMKKGGEDIIKAKENLEKAISLYGDSANGYKYLGIYYYLKDDFDKALESFLKQLENSGKDITLMGREKENLKNDALYDIARTYALKGDSKNSIKYLDILLIQSDNKVYFKAFTLDFSMKKGPFYKIINDKDFKDFFVKVAKKYKK